MTSAQDVSFNEVFASRYERGDFITIRHDKDKGDYTFILSLVKDWNPVHGGTTHFWDAATQSIYKTVSPRFGTMTIFKLTKERQMDHFVSQVVGPGKRDAYTDWFNVTQK